MCRAFLRFRRRGGCQEGRDADVTAEELLVDDGWKVVEIEPEAVGVNGNGRHDAIDIGSTVELALANCHANGNGNGHHAEPTEPQQTLFSWAEFMAEEPVKSKGRSRKPQPASMSMFEWAMERDAEPVGGGR